MEPPAPNPVPLPSGCPSPAALQRVLAKTLSPSEAAVLREHLLGCAPCRALLDGWSNDPQLKEYASASGPRFSPPPRLWQGLRQDAAMPLTPLSNASSAAEVSLAFLAPPQQAGDLGTLGPYHILALLGKGAMGIVLKAYD